MQRIEMVGRKFGKWAVLKEVPKRLNKRAFLCQCVCGSEHVVMGDNLRAGGSTQCRSCSSKIKGKKYGTHRRTGTPLYHVWRSVKLRCRTPSFTGFKNYGGRGIDVCDRWFESFESFLEDMGEPPTPKHQLDRIDNDGNYEPENCRWVLPAVQQNNRRNNRILEHNGQRKTLTQWAVCLGVGVSTLHWRWSAGWPADKILSVPVRKKR